MDSPLDRKASVACFALNQGEFQVRSRGFYYNHRTHSALCPDSNHFSFQFFSRERRLEGVKIRPEGGSTQYVTTEVILKYLETDPALLGISHVILDEAHAHDVTTGVYLGLLML